MRRFLVKNFVLDYQGSWFGWSFKIFGININIPKWTFNAPRASRIIYPLMVITGWFSVTNPDWPNPTFLIWVLYGLLFIALFFGFIYFRIFPAQWEELDSFQKFQYGIFKASELTKQQYREWLEISNNLYSNE